MRTSKNFVTSLFAAALAAVTLLPATHAIGSTVAPVPAAAKAPSAVELGPVHYEPGTYLMTIFTTHVIKASNGPSSAPNAKGQEIAYGYNDCVNDCVGPYGRDKKFLSWCMFACN